MAMGMQQPQIKGYQPQANAGKQPIMVAPMIQQSMMLIPQFQQQQAEICPVMQLVVQQQQASSEGYAGNNVTAFLDI